MGNPSKKEPATSKELKALVHPGDNAVSVGLVDGQSFILAQRIATMLSQSDLMPKSYQGNVPNCIIVLNMAARMGADPLMVAQNLYVVHGNPAWSAQFLIAAFNSTSKYSCLRYEFKGEEGADGWGCRAWAVEKETGERLDGPLITVALAKKMGWWSKIDKNGKEASKWQTMPEQMLRYRAAAWFVRAYAPEIAMGLQTVEEAQDTYHLEKGPDGAFALSDLQKEVPRKKPAAKPASEPETPVTPTDLGSVVETASIHCGMDDMDVDPEVSCVRCSEKGQCNDYAAYLADDKD